MPRLAPGFGAALGIVLVFAGTWRSQGLPYALIVAGVMTFIAAAGCGFIRTWRIVHGR